MWTAHSDVGLIETPMLAFDLSDLDCTVPSLQTQLQSDSSLTVRAVGLLRDVTQMQFSFERKRRH